LPSLGLGTGIGQVGREHDQRHDSPARRAALPEPERSGWPGHVGSGAGLWRAVAGVVLPDQRLAVHARGTSDGADVPARIEVAAASGEVVLFDPPDDRLPDSSPLADLRNSQTSLAPCRCQDLTDAHAAPPLPDRAAARLRRGCRYRLILPWFAHRERSPDAGIRLPAGENRGGLPACPLPGVRDRENTATMAPSGAAAERARQPRESPGTSMAFRRWSSGSATTLPVRLRRPAPNCRLVPYRSAAGSRRRRQGGPGRRRRPWLAGSGSGRCAWIC
jgi:hypothetical protein